MKRKLAWLLAALFLFAAGCRARPSGQSRSFAAAPGGEIPPALSDGPLESDESRLERRWWTVEILDVSEDGCLVAGMGDLYGGDGGPELAWMTVPDGAAYRTGTREALPGGALRPGMIVRVPGAPVREAWPARFETDTVEILEERAGRTDLFRRVILDMWEEDPGLNGGAERLGFDFSGACLTAGEQKGLAYLAARDLGFGMDYLSGTWEELCEQGYIDREDLVWEDGVFFSISVTGVPGRSGFTFDAQKWRSGLGAIFYENCTARRGPDGAWEYAVGQLAVA